MTQGGRWGKRHGGVVVLEALRPLRLDAVQARFGSKRLTLGGTTEPEKSPQLNEGSSCVRSSFLCFDVCKPSYVLMFQHLRSY